MEGFWDSIVHRNGDYADTPIALVEVQGYVYQAKMDLASLYGAIGDREKSSRLEGEAKGSKNDLSRSFGWRIANSMRLH